MWIKVVKITIKNAFLLSLYFRYFLFTRLERFPYSFLFPFPQLSASITAKGESFENKFSFREAEFFVFIDDDDADKPFLIPLRKSECANADTNLFYLLTSAILLRIGNASHRAMEQVFSTRKQKRSKIK